MELNRTELVAHIIGGSIVGMMMVNNSNKFINGSEIRLRDKILKHTVPFQKKLTDEQRESIANIVYSTIMEADGGDNVKVNPVTFIESLAFDFEKEMLAFFDGDIMDTIVRYTEKNQHDALESYKYADRVRNNLRKKIYDAIKEGVLDVAN